MPARKISAAPLAKAGTNQLEAINTVIDWYKRARDWDKHRREWSVTIASDDRLYDRVHRWLTDQGEGGTPVRALHAKLGSMYSLEVASDGDYEKDQAPPRVALYYDSNRDKTVTLEGHRITVALEKPEVSVSGIAATNGRFTDTIRFRATTEAGQQAVIRLLDSLALDRVERKPALRVLSRWGNWDKRDDLPPRPIGSVILRAGQMERIRDDFQQFLDAEPEYNRRGLPWHRGYLFHGPPGTGKTSAIRALAVELKLDLYYAPLGDLEDDTSLMRVISDVRPRSVLLLEDFDVYHASRARDDETKGKVTMAGLLNALDGVATPHGLITVITTNNRDAIDPALLRPGRVDLDEHIGLADADQVARAWGWYYDRHPYPVGPTSEVPADYQTIAQVIGMLKQFPDDPLAARDRLLAFQDSLASESTGVPVGWVPADERK